MRLTKDEMNIVCSLWQSEDGQPVAIKDMSNGERTRAIHFLNYYAKRSLFQYNAPCADTGKTIGEMIDILERANNQSALTTPNYLSETETKSHCLGD